MITIEQRRFIRQYYIWTFLCNANFAFGINILYYHNDLGFSLAQASFLVVAAFATSALFDAWGGSLADRYGRKRTYIIGTCIFLSGTIIPLFFLRNFYVICALTLVGGIGLALASNAIGALAADTLQNQKNRFERLNANGHMVYFLSRASAIIAGGWLYTIAPTLPFVAFLVASVSGMLIVSRMREQRVTAQSAISTASAPILEVLHDIRTNKPYVWRVIIAGAVSSFTLNVLFIHYQPFFDAAGFSPVIIGYIMAGIAVTSAFGSWSVKYLHMRKRRLSVLFWCTVVTGINGIAFMSGSLSCIFIGCLLMGITSGMVIPTIRLSVSEHSPSNTKATALSISSMIASSAVITACLLGGYIGDHGTTPAVGSIALVGSVLFVVAFIGKRYLARNATPVMTATTENAS